MDKVIKFLLDLDPQVFVELHQQNWKDYYLTEIDGNVDEEELLWELGMAEIIEKKYLDFFNILGEEKTYIWLNPHLEWEIEDWNRNEIKQLLCKDIDDHISDKLDELFFEEFSSRGFSWFVWDVKNLMIEERNKKISNILDDE